MFFLMAHVVITEGLEPQAFSLPTKQLLALCLP
jgi:hypothetical protein